MNYLDLPLCATSASIIPNGSILLTVSQVPYQVWPVGLLLEQLSIGQEKGRITLILDNMNLARVQSQTDLVVWDSPAIQNIKRQKGYGVYTISDAQQVRRPRHSC